MDRQMAPWMPLFTQSIKNNKKEKHPFTTFQFSTVETDKGVHKPKVRTVVLRDFLFNDKTTNVLTFNTDIRSEKLSNTGGQFFESCFYFADTWEQYRFSGEWFIINLSDKHQFDTRLLAKYGILIREDEETLRFPNNLEWNNEVIREWQNLSRSAKSLYRKPAPGNIMTSEMSEKLDKIQRGVDGAKEDAGLEHFVVACMCIDHVDYLNLKDGRGGERRLFQRIIEPAELDPEDNEYDEFINGHEIWVEEDVCP